MTTENDSAIPTESDLVYPALPSTPYGVLAAKLGPELAREALDALELAARRRAAQHHFGIIAFDVPGGNFGAVHREPLEADLKPKVETETEEETV